MSSVSKADNKQKMIHAKELRSAGGANQVVQVNRFAQATKLQCLSLWARECEGWFFLWTLGMFPGTTDPKDISCQ